GAMNMAIFPTRRRSRLETLENLVVVTGPEVTHIIRVQQVKDSFLAPTDQRVRPRNQERSGRPQVMVTAVQNILIVMRKPIEELEGGGAELHEAGSNVFAADVSVKGPIGRHEVNVSARVRH